MFNRVDSHIEIC